MFYQKDVETMRRADIEALQLQKLKKMVDYCYNNIPFYHERLQAAGVTGDKIKTLSDIQYIPFTTKDDIRDNYPFGMMACPMKDVVRIHASSGTTGKPTVGVYTQKDIDFVWVWAVYRGAWPALWLGKVGCNGHSGLFWKYTETADDVP